MCAADVTALSPLMPDTARDRIAPVAHRAPGLLLRRLDDRRLCQLVAGGDERAFELLFDRHHQALLAFCRHTLSRREEGEDALQQTFLRAHQALLAGRVPDDLRPWLFTIARNRCRTMLAARRDRAEVPAAAAAEPSVDGLASQVGQREDLRALLVDLADLAEEQRTALVLFEMGDLRHEQIARVLEVDVRKVRQLVYQARTNLLASRDAREAPCSSIREQLATARGGVLRRGPLRRHIKLCHSCRAFAASIADQRAALGLALPVIPTVGLKAGLLGLVGGGGVANLTTAGSLGAGLAANVTAAKIVVAFAVAGAGAGAAAAVTEPDDRPATAGVVAAQTSTVVAPTPAAGAPFSAATAGVTRGAAASRAARRGLNRRSALRRARRMALRRHQARLVRRESAARRTRRAVRTLVVTGSRTATTSTDTPAARRARRSGRARTAATTTSATTTTTPTTTTVAPTEPKPRVRPRPRSPRAAPPATTPREPTQTTPAATTSPAGRAGTRGRVP
jgi:RNA polymerase sigma factor (sigma-70 family)